MSGQPYWHPGYAHPISADHLRESEPEFQKEVMRDWFFQNYEDPAENTPYESKEGGYIYIWGGPYNAREELSSEFCDLVPEEVIEELVEEMETHSHQWSGKPRADGFDDYYFSVIASNTEFYKTLLENLDNIEALLNIDLDSKLQQPFLRLLYANVVTGLETFLSDAFINTVIGNPALLQKFVETNPDFEKRKLTLSEIFTRMNDLEKEISNYLLDLIWYNLVKIKPMYKTTLDIDFPDDLKPLFKAIVIRHDIVHRNGKTKEGKEIKLSQADVEQLLTDIRHFGQFVDKQFEENEF